MIPLIRHSNKYTRNPKRAAVGTNRTEKENVSLFKEQLRHLSSKFSRRTVKVRGDQKKKTTTLVLISDIRQSKGEALPSESAPVAMETVATAEVVRVVIRPIRAEANYGMCLGTCK